MKIEGMQYPLPLRPVGQRGGHSHSDVDISDDAVYFEPDERRENGQPDQQHEQPAEKQETLEGQVSSEKIEATPILPADQTPKEKELVRPPLNIVV